MESKQGISTRGKRRLQLAANFLRTRKFKFNGSNFYDLVMKTIHELAKKEQEKLKELVDWVEDYEVTAIELYGHQPAPARLKKHRNAISKDSSSQRFPAQNKKGI